MHQASASISRFCSTNGSPLIRSHTSLTSSTTVSKCDVASYDFVMNTLSSLPLDVGVYSGVIEMNLASALETGTTHLSRTVPSN